MPKPTSELIAILQGMIDGKPYKQISCECGLSVNRIKVVIFRARKRAGLASTYQLIAVTIGNGWCTPPKLS
jgi:DNA-binding NarL/FixJ family response regulator